MELIVHNVGDGYLAYDEDNHFERRVLIRVKFDFD